MASARKIADRIAMLYQGKIIWDGPTARDRPQRQSLCRPVHPRPRRRPDQDGGRAERSSALPAARMVTARSASHFRLPGLRRRPRQMGGQVRSLRRLEHDRRGRRPAALGRAARGRAQRGAGGSSRSKISKARTTPPPRRVTGIAEFDRVCGGGLVPGSALLVGGDPGVGKSTLILQALAAYAQDAAASAVYISGEEAMAQVRLRAARMGCPTRRWRWARRPASRTFSPRSTAASRPASSPSIPSRPSGPARSKPRPAPSRRCAPPRSIWCATPRRRGAALLLVGHVTKDGQIAGPKAVEHLVDAVLYFEGERGHHFRILRAVKNRFGPTDEIGVFEMTGRGPGGSRQSVGAVPRRPRQQLAGHGRLRRASKARGPLLVEVQALVAAAGYGTPRRAVVGWDTGRLAMILAVLDARGGLGVSAHDVYLNVAGGLKIGEPAADLAAAAALISSSFGGRSLPSDTVFFGEISLSGDVRPAPQAELRLKEAAKLGFTRPIVPAGTNIRVEGLALASDQRCGRAGPASWARTRGLRRNMVKCEFDESRFHVHRRSGDCRWSSLSTVYAAYPRLRERDTFDLRLGRRGLRHALFRPLLSHHTCARICRRRWSATLSPMRAIFLVVLVPLSFISYRFSREREEFAGRCGGPRTRHHLRHGARAGACRHSLYRLLHVRADAAINRHLALQDARLYPVIRGSSDMLLALVPNQNLGPELELRPATDETPQSTPPGMPGKPGPVSMRQKPMAPRTAAR